MAEKEDLLFEEAELMDFDIEENLKNLLFFTLDEAIEKMESAGIFTPFTVTLAGEDLFVDTHPGDDPDTCFTSAKDAVNVISHLASAYTYCYDGFVMTEEDGEVDAIIIEIVAKDGSLANAYCLAYTFKNGGDEIEFDEGLIDLGEVESMYDESYKPIVDQEADEAE